MPFRCKCGRTFEKPDSFSSHTSACASFHKRRMSETSSLTAHLPQPKNQSAPAPPPLSQSQPVTVPPPSSSSTLPSSSYYNSSRRPQSVPSIYTSPLIVINPSSNSPPTSPTGSDVHSDLGSSPPFFMPTGLSLHNAFEGARKRSMSYGSIFSK
ncbi:hypothetical protein BJ944DRAFT_271508 [Cunninghamella echinulata]|nr:hypothetical protein BJ944DRAFT_271508 [Cunninghamella echinulata]